MAAPAALAAVVATALAATAACAAKHNPWVDFGNLPAGVNQPFSAFPSGYARLPTVSFVVPNLCHDMHDCGVATGDVWARGQLDGYLRWVDAHNSLLRTIEAWYGLSPLGAAWAAGPVTGIWRAGG